ncbi:MAG: prolipoprotein diacylglyceryl transferase family protein [Candidatus Limnocylindrales bacterium]
MPIAVITLTFDPVVRLTDDLVVRWSTIALAAVFAVVLIATGVAARRARLRADDLLSIAVGAVPGAIVAGRLGYMAIHPETFAAGPGSILDPAIGGLELGAAVVGGVLTATYVAILLAAPVGRWAHLAAVPVLVAIGGGKLAMLLGGGGQGLPTDVAWATAYEGTGPWGSLAPELASHPAQAYEGLATLVMAAILALALGAGAFRSRDGRLLLIAIAGWAVVRAAVSVTWRDPIAAPPLPAGGWLAVALAIGAVSVALLATVMRRRQRGAHARATQEPAWPEPESRPRF